MHPQMPPKQPFTARPPQASRRNHTNAAGKLIPGSSHPTPITPTSIGSAAVVIPTPNTVIPANLENSQNTLLPDHTVTGKPSQTPSHAATLLPLKARFKNPGLAKPDVGEINVDINANMEKSVENGKNVLGNFGPEKSIVEGGEAVVMSGDGKDESLIQGVTGDVSGKGKKKIVKKIVKVVKKVIVKKRVPKRVLMGGSENQGLVEINNKSSNLANDAIAKSSFFNVNVGSEMVNERVEKSDVVNDGFVDKPSLVDGVPEKNSLVDEVMEKSEHDKVALIACEKSNDMSGFEFMEAKESKLSSCARGSELVEPKSNVVQQSDKARKKNGSYAVQNRKTGNGGILENDRVDLSKGLLFSGEMKNEIFVGGLDKGTNEYDIRKVFEEAGKIVEVRLAKNGKTGRDKCFAFVSFATAADANNALQKYSNVEICGKKCNASMAKTFKKSNKQRKRVSNHASKKVAKDYSQASQASIKLNEPRNINTSSYTNDRFVHRFSQQASRNYIPPPHNIGAAISEYRFPRLGTKRPFSLMGHDPCYAEPKMLPTWHFGSSYPIPGPRVPFNRFSMAPFPYYHQQRPGPFNGSNMRPGHFQANEQAPHYGNYNPYP